MIFPRCKEINNNNNNKNTQILPFSFLSMYVFSWFVLFKELTHRGYGQRSTEGMNLTSDITTKDLSQTSVSESLGMHQAVKRSF